MPTQIKKKKKKISIIKLTNIKKKLLATSIFFIQHLTARIILT